MKEIEHWTQEYTCLMNTNEIFTTVMTTYNFRRTY